MSFLFYIVFILSAHPAYSRWTFANILDASLLELRTKRQASCDEEIQIAEGGSAFIQLRTELYNNTEFYKANEDYTWCVKTPEGNNMIITSEYFRVEQSEECAWDYVEIREKNLKNSKFCGRNPFTYITFGEEIVIQFKSDVSYEHRGFKFLIDSASTDESKCNSSIVGGEDSKILNKVDVGAGCFYRIEAPEDKVIELKFKTLYFGSAPCEDESILIYQGSTNQGEPLGRFCSDAAVVERVLPYHVNTVFIEYRNPTGQERDRFELLYSFVDDTFTPAPTPSTTPSPVGGNNDCSGFYKDITSGEMIYKAPEYQDNKECVIVVRNTLDPLEVVQIHFDYFHLEDSNDCMFDSLKILSGERKDSLPLGGPYCGKSLNHRTLITNGNSVRLEFKTDDSYALKGFQAHITFIPSKECKCPDSKKCIRQGFEKICIRATNCPKSACKNGGTCLNNGTHETCYCAPGYRGIDCSESDSSSAYHLHFKRAPEDISLRLNQPHFEQCAVEAQPNETALVEYQWTLNGAFIGKYNKVTGFGTDGTQSDLLQIDKFRDELVGQYSCIAIAPSGKAEHTFEYRLATQCSFKFLKGPSSEQKKIGAAVRLECTVDTLSAKKSWMKDNRLIDVENNPSKFQLFGSDKHLIIKNLTMEDAGVYKCAVDHDGCYDTIEGTLTVINVKHVNEYCGISVHDENTLATPRITLGRDARPKENPWHVTLRALEDNEEQTFCGGTVISRTFVLTAAHCITEFEKNIKKPWSKDSVKMIFGTTNCSGVEPDGTIRSPKSYTIHPDYQKHALYDSDIALIELDSALEYSDYIRPICLKPASYNDKMLLGNIGTIKLIYGRAAGCGYTSVSSRTVTATSLQQVHLPYVQWDECEEYVASLTNNNYTLTKAMICAGSKHGNKAKAGDTCQGDSGGGLIMPDENRWVQTGIVSHGAKQCGTSYGIYTNVGIFYGWINSITKFTEEEVPDFLGWKLKR